MKRILAVLLTLILAGGIVTVLLGKQALTVRDGWARPALAGQNSAVYMIIDNRTGSADTLTRVACPDAQMAQIHQTSMDASGVAAMRPVESITVDAKTQLGLQPGSYHVMLMQVQKNLQPGDILRCTLTFTNAGSLTLEAPVRQP
jgi:periplasmic copper chaperone A